jgi:hypothetical protein
MLAGTSPYRICAAALLGKYTAAEIAKAAGLREDQVVHRLPRHRAQQGRQRRDHAGPYRDYVRQLKFL